MQFHELFAADFDGTPATHPVTFRALPAARDSKKPPPRPREVSAVFVLVDEPDSMMALREAAEAVAEQYKGLAVIPNGVRGNEEIYHMLFRAIRDPDNPSKTLFRTLLELRRAVIPSVAGQLFSAYEKWRGDEFPDVVTPEEMKTAEDDAAGKS